MDFSDTQTYIVSDLGGLKRFLNQGLYLRIEEEKVGNKVWGGKCLDAKCFWTHTLTFDILGPVMACSFRWRHRGQTQPNCKREESRERKRSELIVYFPLTHKCGHPRQTPQKKTSGNELMDLLKRHIEKSWIVPRMGLTEELQLPNSNHLSCSSLHYTVTMYVIVHYQSIYLYLSPWGNWFAAQSQVILSFFQVISTWHDTETPTDILIDKPLHRATD